MIAAALSALARSGVADGDHCPRYLTGSQIVADGCRYLTGEGGSLRLPSGVDVEIYSHGQRMTQRPCRYGWCFGTRDRLMPDGRVIWDTHDGIITNGGPHTVKVYVFHEYGTFDSCG